MTRKSAPVVLSTHLDDLERKFLGGQTVTGRVEVRARRDVRCKRLTATCRWRTHGKCSSDTGAEQTLELFTGRWSAGERFEYPFEFTLPEEPLSFRGRLFNIDWEVNAATELGRGEAPESSTDFLVLPPRQRRDVPASPLDEDWVTAERTHGVASIGWPLLGAAICALWTLWAFDGWTYVIDDCAVPAAFTVWGLAYAARNTVVLIRARATQLQLGVVHLDVSRTHLARGQETECHIALAPPRGLSLRSITVKLIRTERATTTNSSGRDTEEDETVVQEYTLHRGGSVRAGAEVEGSATIALPRRAAPTFKTWRCELSWRLDVRVDVARFPDWTESIPITVVP